MLTATHVAPEDSYNGGSGDMIPCRVVREGEKTTLVESPYGYMLREVSSHRVFKIGEYNGPVSPDPAGPGWKPAKRRQQGGRRHG